MYMPSSNVTSQSLAPCAEVPHANTRAPPLPDGSLPCHARRVVAGTTALDGRRRKSAAAAVAAGSAGTDQPPVEARGHERWPRPAGAPRAGQRRPRPHAPTIGRRRAGGRNQWQPPRRRQWPRVQETRRWRRSPCRWPPPSLPYQLFITNTMMTITTTMATRTAPPMMYHLRFFFW